MLKVSGHRDQRSAQLFRSGDEISGLGSPGNRQCRMLTSLVQGECILILKYFKNVI